MLKRTLTAVVMATISFTANADEPAKAAPKAGFCRSPNLLISRASPSEITIYCEHIGMVRSVNAIYEKGFRVVSSGVIPENLSVGFGEIYFIIESTK